jgi:hypothetical protein
MNVRTHRASAIALVMVPAAVFVAVASSARDARAATINVNTFNMTIDNDKLCSLPEAINAVNNQKAGDGCPAGNGSARGGTPDVITLQATTANVYNASPSTPPMVIRRSVTIQGAGSNPLDGPLSLIYATALPATNQALFEVNDTTGTITVNFTNLALGGTVQPGQGANTTANGAGILGISNQHGSDPLGGAAGASTINVTGLVITGFQASGLSIDGYNLNVSKSDIEYNQNSQNGGGILYTDTNAYGTILETSTLGPNLVISQSTVANNTAPVGGGVEYDGFGTSSINNSTISDNIATGFDGDGFAGGSGGLDLVGAAGTFAINSSTIAFNSGGGVAIVGGGDDGAEVPSTMNATIVADNYDASNFTPDDVDSDSSLKVSHSMIQTVGSATFVDEGNNFNGQDPGFGSLEFFIQPQAFGGAYPLPVLALSAGSPAIDKLTSLNGVTVDERGFLRPVNGKFDIGAFEFDPNTQAEELQLLAISNATATVVSGNTNCPGCSNGQGLLLTSTSKTATNSFAEYYDLTTPAGADGFYDIIVNYATGPKEGTVQFQLAMVDSACNFVKYENIGGPLNLNAKTDGFLAKGGFDYKVSIDLDSDCNYSYRFNLLSDDTTNNEVLVDYINLKFVKGD